MWSRSPFRLGYEKTHPRLFHQTSNKLRRHFIKHSERETFQVSTQLTWAENSQIISQEINSKAILFSRLICQCSLLWHFSSIQFPFVKCM